MRKIWALIWWISPWNMSWKFAHRLSILPPKHPPNFSRFEVSWAEIEFWFECWKCFSLFVSWWFVDLLSFQGNWIYFSCKGHVEMRVSTEPFFSINLSSIRYQSVYGSRTQFLALFFSDVTSVLLFDLKKRASVVIRMLTCSFKELKTFDLDGMRKIWQEKGPDLMNICS